MKSSSALHRVSFIYCNIRDVSTQSTALVVHTTQNYARQITPPASNASMRKPAVCSAVRPDSRPSMACAFATSSAPKPPSPGPCGCHIPRSREASGLPAARHSPTIWRRDITEPAATRHTSPAAPHALRSPSLLVTCPAPVERARVHSPQLRRSRAARAAPAPLPRHSRAATAREFPCCLRTDKGAGLGLAWQRVGGELQRGENVAESEAEAEHREMPAGWKGTRTLGTVGRPPARDISLWRAASKRPHVT